MPRPRARSALITWCDSTDRWSSSSRRRTRHTTRGESRIRAAGALLLARICGRWEIPLDREHVVGHRELFAAKRCPGNLDPERLIAEWYLRDTPPSPEAHWYGKAGEAQPEPTAAVESS